MDREIVVRGAREHNLRSVDLTLPRGQLICFTGVSGSGKSSMAFDTLYAEGQRRYLESLSSYARQFVGQLPKPDVDFLSGLSPAISISQKSTGNNPRSTVGTITEIYDFLRVLFARVGTCFCPACRVPIEAQTRDQIVASILRMDTTLEYAILAPLIRGQKGEHKDLFEDLRKQGYGRARVDDVIVSLSSPPSLDRLLRHNIEVVIDRLSVVKTGRQRLEEAVDAAIRLGEGTFVFSELHEGQTQRERDRLFSSHYACPKCGVSYTPPTPQLLSFNSPQGKCDDCDGLGERYTFSKELLITDPKKSIQGGAIALLGKPSSWGRWTRVLFRSVAATMEGIMGLPEQYLLKTAWNKLTTEEQDLWFHGTGDRHLKMIMRNGKSPKVKGGSFEGLIAKFLSEWNRSKSPILRRQYEKYMQTIPCHGCGGQRLNPHARQIRLRSNHQRWKAAPWLSLPEVANLPLNHCLEFFQTLELSDLQSQIAGEALKEITARLGFLLEVGLEYLCLSRTAPTLSGGESQRIRLASQIGSGLVGVLYVLDEPSIGLHPRDNDRLLQSLKRLRDLGNTLIVVEHDEDTMRAADYLVDFGPGPGVRGGEVVAQGGLAEVVNAKTSVTGGYLSRRESIPRPQVCRVSDKWLTIQGATHNNLKNIDVTIPLGCFTCVTGVSGSGKSSLITDILSPALQRELNDAETEPGAYRNIVGIEFLDKIIDIDQSPIGRTPRSNPATYVKLFDEIRDLFALLPESKMRGFLPGRFSFNTTEGRCGACEGNGSIRLAMELVADIWIPCAVCGGKRYDYETLQVLFKGKSIADCLDLDVQQALEHFANHPKIATKLQTLHDVGLDYLKLGQPSPTLSGGEAQRIKLSKELSRRDTGKTLYVLDEPTTGLHFADVAMLLKVLQSLVDRGNTVVVVEHNLDLIQAADWVIDLGPEGGGAGGEVVATGTPAALAKNKKSYTGKSLLAYFSDKEKRLTQTPKGKKPKKISSTKHEQSLTVRGAGLHNLCDVDMTLPLYQMSVFCGPSGSGKTSMAFDTIYAEGQRRYVESLSSYARQFVGQMPKPVLEGIEGLSPAVALEQKNLGHTPRSTVGTVTEIYDYFRVLMARVGQMHCTQCKRPVGTQSPQEITEAILRLPVNTKVLLTAPLAVSRGADVSDRLAQLQRDGYVRFRINRQVYDHRELPTFSKGSEYEVEVVIDRLKIQDKDRSRIADSVETGLGLGLGTIHIVTVDETRDENLWETTPYSQHLACQHCQLSYEPLTPHSFSFNSQLGWCPSCMGLGVQRGTNPAQLMDLSRSLRDGGLFAWTTANDPALSSQMMEGFSQATGISLDIPLGKLSPPQMRQLLFGTGDLWIPLPSEPGVTFQFRGIYPTLSLLSRVSNVQRMRLEAYMAEVPCMSCNGARVRPEAAASQWRGMTVVDLVHFPLGELWPIVKSWQLDAREQAIAGELIREIEQRLEFLIDVGLDYLTLSRSANSLSGGEAQRIRLASQLGSGLCGVLYVLDEPTIGLHPRDNHRLLTALHKLRNLGNTLVVVEHDREVIAGADQLCDFGPGSGRNGGQLVAQGTPLQVSKNRKSITGPYLSGKKGIAIPNLRRPTEPLPPAGSWLTVRGARQNTLQRIDVAFPLGCLIAVTGPSGSGKSSLIDDILYPALARKMHRAHLQPGTHDAIEGVSKLDKVIMVNQSPLGASPASNAATYSGVFDLIRELYSKLPEARVRGFTARQFSFNVPGGRCERCEGNGQLKIEMHFLPDVWVRCDACQGKRYTEATLSVRYQGLSIHDLLEMQIGNAFELLKNFPRIRHILKTLCDVGLEYLSLGQAASTLSGGEAQRVKLAAELARPATGKTLYLLDEPTTGLHFDDVAKLLKVLHRLVDVGNTVVVVEHNLDVIKTADWVLDMGPEAGNGGGYLVASGTPEQLVATKGVWPRETQPAPATLVKGKRSKAAAKVAATATEAVASLSPMLPDYRSYTAEALAPVLAAGPYETRTVYDPTLEMKKLVGDVRMSEVGKETRTPWEVDGRKWHLEDSVARNGNSIRWERRCLEEVIQYIESCDTFAPTNWASAHAIHIAMHERANGWFFQADTSHEWLLKLVFRVPHEAYAPLEVRALIDLPSLNEYGKLPIYGNKSRLRLVRASNYLSVELEPHEFKEIDHPKFWEFLKVAMLSFLDSNQTKANKQPTRSGAAGGKNRKKS